jgi:hypothetical protein
MSISKQSITVALKDFDGAARFASKLENTQSLNSTLSILWSARSADHRMDEVPFNC